MKQTLIFCFLILFFQKSVFSFVGAGIYVPSVGSWQIDQAGGSNAFQFNSYLFTHHHFPLSAEHAFRPGLGYVFNRNTYNTSYTKNSILLRYEMSYFFDENLAFLYGLGNIITEIRGKGGLQRLQNGNSYSYFYNPAVDTVRSYNTTLNLGVEYFFVETLAAELSLYILEFLSKERRAFSYSLSVHYNFR